MEHVILHRDDTMYYLGPSLAVLADGDVLMGLREAHARPAHLRGHVDPASRSVVLRSRDGGRRFAEKRVVDDQTHRFSSSQDTTVTALSDGSILATMYTWGIAPVPAGVSVSRMRTGLTVFGGADKPFVSIFEGLWTCLSRDGGITWTPRRPVDVEGLPPLAARAPVSELEDGTLILQTNDISQGIGRARDWARIHCLRSYDGGETWGEPSLAAEGSAEGVHFLEPSMMRLRNGTLISMLRTRGGGREEGKGEGPHGYLYQTVSKDDGRTWSRPARTPVWGFPAHVLELTDGRVLCTYGYRHPPYGVRACLSGDGGETWDVEHEIVIRDDGGTSDLGYPFALQLDDSTVLIAYYFNQEREGDPESTTRYIAGTYLRV